MVLTGLNPQQEEAVRLNDRHLLVVAGAGSGKTRVLTYKISFLIEDLGIYPDQILAMTFSNKAANEMKERVRTLLPTFEQPRWVGTFHSICLRILKEFYDEAQLSPQFTIYDESDQLSALKHALYDLNFDPKQTPPKTIRYHIDRAKNETDRIVEHIQAKGILSDKALSVVKRYEEILKQNQALDFGDLIGKTTRLLKEHPKVTELLQNRWARILIDEYQDTNRIQKELVQTLSGATGTVCAVGDEDQSIYAWRGARVENILEFPQDFPGAEIVKLEQNYRSTRQILEVANHVISHNVGRRKKNLWTQNEEGSSVTFFQAQDDHSEAAFVLNGVQELLKEEENQARNIAIFYRTHVQSRLLEEECRRRNQPYKVFGGTRFYDRAEIKDALAFLKLAVNPSDRVSFQRIINTPPKGIGKQTLAHLFETAESQNRSVLEAIPFLGHKGKAEKALHEFHHWFCELRQNVNELTPEQATELLLRKSGYLKALEEEGSVEADSRIENLEELLRSMQEFGEELGEENGKGITAYLDRISLITDVDQYDNNDQSIILMTVHNSKGLEFDAVFLVGMEEGIFPHQRSLEEGSIDEIEEERRLCYVAMTRTRKQLVLTAAARRRLYQSVQFNPVSRFVGEIPAKHLIQVYDPALSSAGTGASSGTKWNRRYVPKDYEDDYEQLSYDDFDTDQPQRNVWEKNLQKTKAKTPYGPGAKIIHPDFGLGTIKRCEGDPDNLKLTIQFARAGVKKILLNYCSLELVEH